MQLVYLCQLCRARLMMCLRRCKSYQVHALPRSEVSLQCKGCKRSLIDRTLTFTISCGLQERITTGHTDKQLWQINSRYHCPEPSTRRGYEKTKTAVALRLRARLSGVSRGKLWYQIEMNVCKQHDKLLDPTSTRFHDYRDARHMYAASMS